MVNARISSVTSIIVVTVENNVDTAKNASMDIASQNVKRDKRNAMVNARISSVTSITVVTVENNADMARSAGRASANVPRGN
jgi:hypothetical protein